MLVVFAAIVDIVVFPSPPQKKKLKTKQNKTMSRAQFIHHRLFAKLGPKQIARICVAGGVWSVFFSFCREKHTNLKYTDDAFPLHFLD